jgi:MinD-like ATPase involved in chromosome partitioning or flagellar assembly
MDTLSKDNAGKTDKKRRPPGRVITFYSYKGGTGRTMALANVAWILASAGRRVLVIDWDFEAPGLHRYLHPFIDDKEIATTPGLIDFFTDFTMAARMQKKSATPAVDERPWYESSLSLLGYAVPIGWSFQGDGALDFVPAGRQDAAYSARVTSFDWQAFYDTLGGGVFLEALKRQLREDYDYVLIDSRTGISDTSGICTVQMPDDLVTCFTFNSQSIGGAAAIAESAHRQRLMSSGEPGLRIWPVPMRVEMAEKERLEAARDRARDVFQKFIGHMPRSDRANYWGSIEVLYYPYFAYEEVLAAFAERRSQTTSLLASMERLAAWVTRGDVTALGVMSEQLRQEGLAKYISAKPAPVERAAPGRGQVYLSYPHQEGELAERIHRFLIGHGVQVWWDREILPGQSWRQEIAKAVAESQVIVAVIPSGHLTTEHRVDIEIALQHKLTVVPVFSPNADSRFMPEGLQGIVGVRLGPNSESETQGLERLLQGVQHVLGQPMPQRSFIDPDDPQKGRWGGTPTANGRALRAQVTALSSDWFDVQLEVVATSGAALTGEVRFHLHPTCLTPLQDVTAINNRASLQLSVWGAFTVGVEADDGKTLLELDLSQDSRFPEVFRQR